MSIYIGYQVEEIYSDSDNTKERMVYWWRIMPVDKYITTKKIKYF